MENVIKLLKNRIVYAEMITIRMSRYLDIIKDIIIGINKDEYQQARANVEIVNKFIRAEYESKPHLDFLLDLYQQLREVDAALEAIISVFNNTIYAKQAVQNMSSTYTTNIYQERNVAIHAMEKYKDISVTDDNQIFSLITESAEDMYMFITAHANIINKFTTKLIGMTIPKVSGDKKRRLEEIIEKQKDQIFETTRVKLSYPGAQGMLVRYGLSPATPSMPLEQLLKYLNRAYVDDHPTIIIYNITKSPVEFDIRPLIDAEYVIENDFKTNPANGLNKKIIRRFDTAKMLDRRDISASSTKIIGDGENWHIIETINGELYRCLGIGKTILIPKSSIAGILHGVTTRCQRYNDIQAEEILKRCFDAGADQLLSDYEKAQPESSLSIKIAILDKLMKDFEQKTIKSVEQLTHVDKNLINGILLGILTHTMGIHGKGAAEYTMTYLTKFDAIVTAFVKELERRWQQESIFDRLFSENSPEELKKILSGIYKHVVKSAIEELDQANTWTEYDMSLKEYFMDKKQVIV